MSQVLSVRLDEQDREKLEALAEDLNIGPSVLARMLIHSSLSTLEELKAVQAAGQFPLALLSTLLAPAAQAKGLTEEDLKRSVQTARKKLWKARYASKGRES